MSSETVSISRESVQRDIIESLARLFDLDQSAITADSLLYDDLDIDSIDAVDLMVHLKEVTGKKVSPEMFKSVRTVGDVVEAVTRLIAED